MNSIAESVTGKKTLTIGAPQYRALKGGPREENRQKGGREANDGDGKKATLRGKKGGLRPPSG